MKSLTELYKIGKGPSSSHTMGPQKAAKIYAKRHPDAHLFDVTLYGSLAATGKGHMTDTAIIEVLSPIATVNIHWEPNIFLPYHPNGMKFTADGADEWIVYSVGGGALSEGKAEDMFDTPEVYEMNSLSEILAWCDQNGRSYWEYVDLCEGDVVWPYLQEVWETMQAPQSPDLLCQGHRLQAVAADTRSGLCLCPCRQRRERLGWHHRHRPHLWCLRRSASRTIPSFQRPQVQRHPHPTRPCHGWNHRQRGQAERLHLRRRRGLPRRGGRSLRYGQCRSLPALRWQPGTDRVCGRDGIGTPPGYDLRPGMRIGTDTLYRAQRLCRNPLARRQPLLGVLRRQAPRELRPRGTGYEADGPRPAFTLQGNEYRWTRQDFQEYQVDHAVYRDIHHPRPMRHICGV